MNKEDIIEIVKPVIENRNCFLWGLEILRGKKRPTLRIYIDSKNGANIDDCENVSKDLNYELALEDSFIEDYILEVSTPGVDRKIFFIEQLDSFIGERFKVKLRNAKDNVKNIEGFITEFNQEAFTIKTKSVEHVINFSDTELCRLNPSFDDILRMGEEYGR
jgi:ribosome maturation factor RimP|tara:strand:- start:1783 stop:2268 length:486 start_codon:yes stop_codon:yes gene_type:complete